MAILPNDCFKDRMQTLIKRFGSQEKLGEACDISGVMIGKYAAGAEPSRDKLVAIAKAAGCNIAWLAAGEGFPDREPAYYMKSENLKNASSTAEPGEGFVHVPRYKVAASAGGGALIYSEQVVDHLAFRADWVKMALGVPVSSLALINVTGDSMEPTLSNGDLILIDTSVVSVDDSGVYVLRFDGKLKVKRLHSKADSVDILSDNPRYPTETLRGDLLQELNVIGRVVWCGRRM